MVEAVDRPGAVPAIAPSPTRTKILWVPTGGLALGLVAALLLGFNVDKLRTRIFAKSPSLDVRSIAVLPLENLSKDPNQDYFSDGITDALTTELAQIRSLRVISRTSAMHFKGTQETLPEIGRKLNVDAIVEGSITRSENRVRVTAQLIDAPSDLHLWAKSYERDLKDILALQDEVARDIAAEIRVQLTPKDQARLSNSRPVEPQAYEAYLRGRYYWDKMSVEGFNQALKQFQQAIVYDSNYAPAYAGLADGYQELSIWGALQPTEASPKSEAAAEKALSLDDTLAQAHASLGNVRFLYDWKWSDAAREFQRALELDPNYATGHIEYAVYLAAMGRGDEAVAEAREAHRLDPISQTTNGLQGYVYLLGRRFDEAISQLQNTIALYPDAAFNHSVLAACYEQKHMYPEAFDEYLKADAIIGVPSQALAEHRRAFAASGFNGYLREELLAQTEESRRFYPYARAEVYARLGQTDLALEWLEKAYRSRKHDLAFLNVNPQLDSLRSDSRFQDLLRRIGLPVNSTLDR
jgi:TolB-like protein